MAKKNSFLTCTDMFCGAGGSSIGAEKAGVKVKMAMNHWKLAIETHSTNFQNTDHDCTDLSASDPRRYPSTDILIASPECTNHSLAKGKKIIQKQMDLYSNGVMDASAERSRATMWDVCRFAEFHNYNAVIVENVVDARKWVMFDAWLNAMGAMGYLHKCVYLNSMHAHPTPQSRDRMYVVFWKKGNRAPDLEYMPLAHCVKCGKDTYAIQSWKNSTKKFGKYRQQYVYCCPNHGVVVEPYYYAAFNCIDWSDRGTRIGDRKKPLSENSVTRIQYGLDKYGNEPLMVVNYSPGYTKPLTYPTAAVTTTDHHGILNPFLVNNKYTSGVGHRTRSVTEKLDTVTGEHAISVVMPFIVKLEHSQRSNNVKPASDPMSTQTIRQSSMLISGYARPADKELQTQTTCQGMGVVVPFIVENKGQSKTKRITEVPGSLTTKPHLGIVQDESWQSFLTSYYNGSHCTKHVTEEVGTVTTGDRLSLVNYQKPNIEDCYYRMLKPPEIQSAMAFGEEYKVLGNSRDKVKQLGNAVTPPAMDWLIQQVVKSLN